MKHLILAITFLTRIYIPNQYTYTEEDFGKSIWYYPLVGGILGGILSGLSLAFSRLHVHSDLSAFILLGLYIGLSGGLHLDGLADVCDGLFSNQSLEKKFEIMKDSRVGTFGVIGLALYFLGMWVALKQSNWQMVLLFPVVGRSMILVASGMSSYAKERGLGKSIVDAAHGVHILLGILVPLAVALLLKVTLMIPLLGTLLVVVLLTKRVHKILLGITGDVLGMMVEVSQCVFLLLGVLIGGRI